MMLEPVTWLGLAAGVLTTVSFVPQLLKVWRTRSADDISTGMFVLFCTGLVLWLTYGVLIHDLAIIVANVVTLVLAGAILALKLKYSRERR